MIAIDDCAIWFLHNTFASFNVVVRFSLYLNYNRILFGLMRLVPAATAHIHAALCIIHMYSCFIIKRSCLHIDRYAQQYCLRWSYSVWANGGRVSALAWMIREDSRPLRQNTEKSVERAKQNDVIAIRCSRPTTETPVPLVLRNATGDAWEADESDSRKRAEENRGTGHRSTFHRANHEYSSFSMPHIEKNGIYLLRSP